MGEIRIMPTKLCGFRDFICGYMEREVSKLQKNELIHVKMCDFALNLERNLSYIGGLRGQTKSVELIENIVEKKECRFSKNTHYAWAKIFYKK